MALYDNILKDKRHSHVEELFQTEIASPVFDEYNSKFNLVTTSFDLVVLKEFLKRRRRSGYGTEVSATVESFLGMDWFQ